MGSQVKPNRGLLVALVTVALIGVGYLLYSNRSAADEAKSLVTPPPRANAPDFGGLPPENVIGSTPGGPSGPGGAGK